MIDPSDLAPLLLRPRREPLRPLRKRAHLVLLELFREDAAGIHPGMTPEEWTFDTLEREHEFAQQLWESLAPESWIGDDRRGFLTPNDEVLSHPRTLAHVILILADLSNVLTVESLAREFLARFQTYSPTRVPQQLVWNLRDAKRMSPDLRFVAPLDALTAPLRSRIEPEMASMTRRLSQRNAAADLLAFRAFAGTQNDSDKAPMPNPFEPLLAIWKIGYAFESLTPEFAILRAPER